MNEEQQQEIERLTGDNSPLSDFSRDAIRALLEDCGRADGFAEYWRIEHGKLHAKLDAVPVSEIRAVVGASVTPMGYRAERDVIAKWLNSPEVQPWSPFGRQ